MSKLLSRQQHGFTDYTYAPLVSVAPEIAGFSDEKTAAALCRVMSSTIFMSSFATRAEWGVLKLIPFKTHCILDIAAGVFSAGAPWLFGFSKNKKARNTFLLMGLFGILAGALSDQEDEMISPDDLERLKSRFNAR